MLIALACAVFQLALPSREVAEADYRSVAAVLEAEGKPGDVVLLSPWWSERARLYLPERFPIVGYQGSDADPLELHPRIWVLAQPRNGGRVDGDARKFGNLALQLKPNPTYRAPSWDARAALASAAVFLETPDGARADCPWDGRAHRCPNGGQVAIEWHEIKFQPRRCIRFYPPGGAQKLVAEFSSVPAAGSVALRAGLTWDRGFFHMPELTRVELGVQINGAAASSLAIPVGVEGLQRSDGPPIPADATVQVWARSANASHRDLCLELYGLEAAK